MRKSAHGFTLVELLVVITIMGLAGVYTLSNYSTFGEEQKLKNAALDIQSLLKQAQANSASNLKCQNQDNVGWQVVFTNNTSLDLKCRNSSGIQPVKNFPLPGSGNITISGFTLGGATCSWGNAVEFAPLYGTMTSTCGSGTITITLSNSKLPGRTKSLMVEQGGRIYEP